MKKSNQRDKSSQFPHAASQSLIREYFPYMDSGSSTLLSSSSSGEDSDDAAWSNGNKASRWGNNSKDRAIYGVFADDAKDDGRQVPATLQEPIQFTKAEVTQPSNAQGLGFGQDNLPSSFEPAHKKPGNSSFKMPKNERKPTPNDPGSLQGMGAFEKHTKGFGSKMLMKMGFQGSLGKSQQGRVEPLQVVVRPRLAGLGAAGEVETKAAKIVVKENKERAAKEKKSAILQQIEAAERAWHRHHSTGDNKGKRKDLHAHMHMQKKEKRDRNEMESQEARALVREEDVAQEIMARTLLEAAEDPSGLSPLCYNLSQMADTAFTRLQSVERSQAMMGDKRQKLRESIEAVENEHRRVEQLTHCLEQWHQWLNSINMHSDRDGDGDGDRTTGLAQVLEEMHGLNWPSLPSAVEEGRGYAFLGAFTANRLLHHLWQSVMVSALTLLTSHWQPAEDAVGPLSQWQLWRQCCLQVQEKERKALYSSASSASSASSSSSFFSEREGAIAPAIFAVSLEEVVTPHLQSYLQEAWQPYTAPVHPCLILHHWSQLEEGPWLHALALTALPHLLSLLSHWNGQIGTFKAMAAVVRPFESYLDEGGQLQQRGRGRQQRGRGIGQRKTPHPPGVFPQPWRHWLQQCLRRWQDMSLAQTFSWEHLALLPDWKSTFIAQGLWDDVHRSVILPVGRNLGNSTHSSRSNPIPESILPWDSPVSLEAYLHVIQALAPQKEESGHPTDASQAYWWIMWWFPTLTVLERFLSPTTTATPSQGPALQQAATFYRQWRQCHQQITPPHSPCALTIPYYMLLACRWMEQRLGEIRQGQPWRALQTPLQPLWEEGKEEKGAMRGGEASIWTLPPLKDRCLAWAATQGYEAGPAPRAAHSTQPFEQGRMLYRIGQLLCAFERDDTVWGRPLQQPQTPWKTLSVSDLHAMVGGGEKEE
jgi:hypothetical protein